LRSKVASGVGYGAIGGAASALVAPLVRDALYDGTQSVTYTDNGDGTLTRTTSYNNSTFNAITAGIATLGGGLAAGLTGASAQAGVTSAENEVLNNTLHQEEEELRRDTTSVAVPLEPRFGGQEDVTTDPETGAEGAKVTVGPGSLEAGLGGMAQSAGTSGTGGAAITGPFQRGIHFQGDALSALGVSENTQRVTVMLPGGSPVTVVPDAWDGSDYRGQGRYLPIELEPIPWLFGYG